MKTNKISKIIEKINHFGGNIILRLDDAIAKKSITIRYKRDNPKGYEADIVVGAAEENINDLDQKLAKRKELSIKDMNVLNKMIMALSRVQNDKAGGKRYQDVELLIEKAMDIAQYQLEKALPEFNLNDTVPLTSLMVPRGI
jgi:hypothetical protein